MRRIGKKKVYPTAPLVIPHIDNLPDVILSRQNIAKGLLKRPFDFSGKNPYNLGRIQGLYDDTVYDSYACNWEARKATCKLSESIVSLLSRGDLHHTCSGIWVEKMGDKKILTSAYILGGRKGSDVLSLEVHVLLANREKVVGSVSHLDENYNLVLIDVVMDSEMKDQIKCVDRDTFATELVDLGVQVLALGRHSNSNILSSSGQVKTRDDHFEFDHLMASNCTISQWVIGGPLINTGGMILGMNFFSKRQSTPFMPSCILLHCLDDLYEKGNVFRPWLGLKSKSLVEAKIHEMEFMYSMFGSLNGIIVKEVSSGSPAEKGGICIGDNIISCNNIPINSPVQLGDLLFKLPKSGGVEQGPGTSQVLTEEKQTIIEVVIQNPKSGETEKRSIVLDYTLSVNISWPVLPPTS